MNTKPEDMSVGVLETLMFKIFYNVPNLYVSLPTKNCYRKWTDIESDTKLLALKYIEHCHYFYADTMWKF